VKYVKKILDKITIDIKENIKNENKIIKILYNLKTFHI